MTNSIALSFSGGGALAAAYLGALREFENRKIPVTHIATHSGATWIFNFLVNGYTDEEIIKELSKFRFWKLFDPLGVPRGSFLNFEKLVKYFEKFSTGKDISDINKYKLSISIADVTDCDNPFEVIKTSGSLAKWSAISTIVPPGFPIYMENGRLYADGGYVTTYSAEHLRSQGCKKIIGLYPDSLKHTKLPPFVKQPLYIMKTVMGQREKYENANFPIDLEIRGFAIEAGINGFKFSKELYDAGRARVVENLDSIEKLLGN